MADYIPTIITNCVSLIVGFGGGYAVHAYNVRRDRINRARDFYQHVAVLLARLTGSTDAERVLVRQAAIPDLRGHCARIANDCRDRDGFVTAVNRFCNMTDENVRNNKKETLDALSALSPYVK